MGRIARQIRDASTPRRRPVTSGVPPANPAQFRHVVASALVLLPVLVFAQEKNEEAWLIPPEKGVVLDSTIQWYPSRPKQSKRRFTDLAAVMRAEGSAPCFIVIEPGAHGSWRHDVDLPIRSGRFPILTVQYRAFGIGEWSPEPVLALTVGTGDRQRTVGLLDVSELKADGTLQELSKDLRPLVGDDHIIALHICLECLAGAEQEACLLLNSITFATDEKALRQSETSPEAKPIRVRVLDGDGNPVEGAVVVADVERTNFVRWTQTEANGTAVLDPVPNETGRHTVRVVAEGYVETEVVFVPNETPTPVTLPLVPGVSCGGTIIDGEGEPLSNVVVRVKAEADIPEGIRCLMSCNVLTDQRGGWTTPLLPATANPLRVALACPAYDNKFKNVALWRDDDLFASVVRGESIIRTPDFAAVAEASRRTWAREVDRLEVPILKQWITDPKRPEKSRLLALDAFERRLSLNPSGRPAALRFFVDWAVSEKSEHFARIAMEHALRSVRARYGHLAWAEAAIRAECDPRLAEKALALAKPLLDMYRSSVTTRPQESALVSTDLLPTSTRATGHLGPVATSPAGDDATTLPTWIRLTASAPATRGPIELAPHRPGQTGADLSALSPITLRPADPVDSLPVPVSTGPSAGLDVIPIQSPSGDTASPAPVSFSHATETPRPDIPVVSVQSIARLAPISPRPSPSATGPDPIVTAYRRKGQETLSPVLTHPARTELGPGPIVPQTTVPNGPVAIAMANTGRTVTAPLPQTWTAAPQPARPETQTIIPRLSPAANAPNPIVPREPRTRADATLVAITPLPSGIGLDPMELTFASRDIPGLPDLGGALSSVHREAEKRREVLDVALVDQGAVEIDELIAGGKHDEAVGRCCELAESYVRGPQSCLVVLALLAKAQPSTPRDAPTTVETTFLACFPPDDPRRPAAEYSVALYLYKNGEAQQACDRLSAFIKKSPDGDLQIRATLTLGLCQIRTGQRDQALASLKGLLERAPHAEEAAKAQFLVGWLHMTQQETSEASKAFAAVVRNHPDSPYAKKAGELLEQTGGR